LRKVLPEIRDEDGVAVGNVRLADFEDVLGFKGVRLDVLVVFIVLGVDESAVI
jgi:hypothetical protein